MKFFLTTTLLLLPSLVLGGPADGCEKQHDCIDIRIEEAGDYSCGATTCLWKVCLKYDSSLDGCQKSGSMSHACDNGEHESLCERDDSANFGMDPRGSENEGFEDGEEMCVYVQKGHDAKFLLKDGGTCEPYQNHEMYLIDTPLSTKSTATCKPSEHKTCSGNAVGVECWWIVSTPYEECAPTPPTLAPTPEATSGVCQAYKREKFNKEIGEGPKTCGSYEFNGLDQDNLPIEIIGTSDEGDEVSFRIKQNFYSGPISRLGIDRHVMGSGSFCDESSDIASAFEKTYTAECFNGVTDVRMYVHFCDQPATCNACQQPSSMDNFAAYAFTLHCMPYCEHDPIVQTLAPTDEEDDCSVIEVESVDYAVDWPATAGPRAEVDETTGIVKVTMKQMFDTFSSSSSQGTCTDGQVDAVSLVYKTDSGRVCDRTESVCRGEALEAYIQCSEGEEYTDLTVYVFDDHSNFSTSKNPNPGMCDVWNSNEKNIAKYEFLVPCKDPCSSERRNLEAKIDDDYYCSKKDFPCGNDNSKVNVCHYSAESGGYQTFCLQEADTDMLKYYPDDYCGPCVEGLGAGLGAILLS